MSTLSIGSEDDYSSLSSSDSILYGYFDDGDLFIHNRRALRVTIPYLARKRRLIQCNRDDKRVVEAYLREFIDFVKVSPPPPSPYDYIVCYIANLSSEECYFLNLASPVDSMIIMDMDEKADEAGE